MAFLHLVGYSVRGFDMKGKISIILGILIIFGVIFFINKKNEEKKIRKAILRNDNEYFTEHLGIKGEFTYGEGKVYVENYYIDENDLKVDVAYYNMFHEDKISYDNLLAEYDIFCKGGKENQYNNLTLFCEYNNGGNHGECELFRGNIIVYLSDNYGVVLYYATQEQLDEAIMHETESFLKYKDAGK